MAVKMASTSHLDALPRITCPNHPDVILVLDLRACDICPEYGLVVGGLSMWDLNGELSAAIKQKKPILSWRFSESSSG